MFHVFKFPDGSRFAFNFNDISDISEIVDEDKNPVVCLRFRCGQVKFFRDPNRKIFDNFLASWSGHYFMRREDRNVIAEKARQEYAREKSD